MDLLDISKKFRAGCANFSEHIFMNFAGLAPMPTIAVEAATRSANAKAMPHRFNPDEFFNSALCVKLNLSKMINSSPQDIALTTGASAGTSLIATSLDFQKGDEIVIVDGDFPSHEATWKPIADRYEVTLKIVTFEEPSQISENVSKMIGPKTKIVSLSHVRYDDGSRLNVKPVASACHENDSLLLLDVSQSIGIVPLDVSTLNADILVGVGYKYLMGPWGTGFLWVSPNAFEQLRPLPWNWTSQDVNSFSKLIYNSPNPIEGLGRLDAAQTVGPFNLNLCAWEASLNFVKPYAHGLALEYTQKLIDQLFEDLPLQYERLTPEESTNRGAIGCFSAESIEATRELFAFLTQEHFSISLRNGRLRIAPHLLNTENEINHLNETIKQWTATPK